MLNHGVHLTFDRQKGIQEVLNLLTTGHFHRERLSVRVYVDSKKLTESNSS